MVDDKVKSRAELEGAVHAASDALHRLTGRTDQSLQQIAALYPDHAVTVAWRKATDEFKGQKR